MRILLVTLAALSLTMTTSQALTVTWVNGDFELGGAAWNPASTTTFGDADGDGDREAFLFGQGDGTFQLSRGVTKGVVPATTRISFDIEEGSLVYDFRMILLVPADPVPYADNLFYYGEYAEYLVESPDGLGLDEVADTVRPDWFNDQVLIWDDWDGATGHVVLDPVAADAANIPGWATMTAAERSAYLAGATHMTLVMYAYASGFQGGATLDNIGFDA